MKNCKFCNIEENRIVVESKLSIAFYDLYPVNIGHSLIAPKRHISDYFELNIEEKNDIWNLVDKVKLLLEKEFTPDGFNVGINIGELAGQTIFHCHIHVIPRYKGDVDYPEGGVRGVIPNKQKYKQANRNIEMNSYIGDFLRVIRNCNVDNTYKMAWAKALVEISCDEEKNERIELKDIAKKIFKYYWNQTIYFDLIQGSNISKPPKYITEVKKKIEEYYLNNETKQPKHFERIDSELKLEIDCLVKILKKNVSWRFLNLKNETVSLYEYRKDDDFLILRNKNIIAEYSDILFESINFRWTQILENFNSSPRIAKKVRVLDLQEIKRNNLKKFRRFLDIGNSKHKCFICGKEIEDETPSLDHVLPWSFLFSDDIWNLVYTHKKCNSSKSNIIPTEGNIKKLEERNNQLFISLKKNPEYSEEKLTKELEVAIEKDFVKKFWVSCKT